MEPVTPLPPPGRLPKLLTKIETDPVEDTVIEQVKKGGHKNTNTRPIQPGVRRGDNAPQCRDA